VALLTSTFQRSPASAKNGELTIFCRARTPLAVILFVLTSRGSVSRCALPTPLTAALRREGPQRRQSRPDSTPQRSPP
jgi:hypothetical protein